MILRLIYAIKLDKSLYFFFLFGRNNFLLDDLFLDLYLKILNIINMLHQFLETVLPAPEILLDLLLVFLHPPHQFFLLSRRLLRLLLRMQLSIQPLSITEVLVIDVFSQLGCCLHGRDRDLSAVDVFDPR